MPLSLFPYQEAGAQFIASRERSGLLDVMGIGKSAQAIRSADLRGDKRIIVICPALAREMWRREWAKFSHWPRRIVKGLTIHDLLAWQRGVFDIITLSYEMATKFRPQIMDACEVLDLVIIDEGHAIKDEDAKRTKAVIGRHSDGVGGIVQWAARAVWMTGTPAPNDSADIYTFLKFCRATALTKRQFIDRYFHSRQKTYSAAHTPKVDMLPELHAMIANNSIRRTLDQVGFQLPPVFLTTAVVDGDTAAIAEFLFQFPGLDTRILDSLRAGKGLSGLDDDHIATLRRLIGEAKALPYAHMLLGELQGGLDKMVTFGLHKRALISVRDYLWQHSIKCGIINGDTPEKDRQSYIEQFQADADFRVLILNMRAGGTAITLTASAHIDLLEQDWSPGMNAQALKRVHRIGQMRSVQARLFGLARSFDETVAEVVSEKTASVAMIEGFKAA